MTSKNKYAKVKHAQVATVKSLGPVRVGSPLHRLLELVAHEVAKNLPEKTSASTFEHPVDRRR
jgi:hypothetical protein